MLQNMYMFCLHIPKGLRYFANIFRMQLVGTRPRYKYGRGSGAYKMSSFLYLATFVDKKVFKMLTRKHLVGPTRNIYIFVPPGDKPYTKSSSQFTVLLHMLKSTFIP